MKRNRWIWAAAILVCVGCLLVGGAMMSQNWKLGNLSTATFETKEYRLAEAYKNISITVDEADVIFQIASGTDTVITCYEDVKQPHKVAVTGDTLSLSREEGNWRSWIGIHMQTPRIVITLPQGEYEDLTVKGNTGDVQLPAGHTFQKVDIAISTGDIHCQATAREDMKLKVSTGDILLEDANAGALELKASTGEIRVTNVNCAGDISLRVSTGKVNLTNVICNKSITSQGNTGHIALADTIAGEGIVIARSTGDVELENCDARQIQVNTSTGDVTGCLLTGKNFQIQTDTGDVEVPASVAEGDLCQIKTSTGDIKFRIIHS